MLFKMKERALAQKGCSVCGVFIIAQADKSSNHFFRISSLSLDQGEVSDIVFF